MQSWAGLMEALGDTAARLQLRPGANEATIAAAEAVLGYRLPADYRAWLAIADGQEVDPDGETKSLSILPTMGWFASIERVVSQWREARTFDLDDYAVTETQDKGRVRFFVGHPHRLAIAGSEHLGEGGTLLDLIPGPSGSTGQLITMTSECDFAVIGESLSRFFERIAVLVSTGKLVPAVVEYGYQRLVMPKGGNSLKLVRGDRQR